MRALEQEVKDAVWQAVAALSPQRADSRPLGCHRRRAPDRLCFEGILLRLVTGCSWVTAERLSGGRVSDTTLRARRDEWADAGVFDALADEAVAASDRVVGLDLAEVSVDGSSHKAPCGGEGTGPNPADRGKRGWKWSVMRDRAGIPVGWAADGANRRDQMLFEPTIAAAAGRGLLADAETPRLDRGYDTGTVRACAAGWGIDDLICARRRPHGAPHAKTTAPLGMRRPVERTNSWLSNFGQLRRNTDRRPHHRLAQLALAIALLICIKLIDWRNRWSPPIR